MNIKSDLLKTIWINAVSIFVTICFFQIIEVLSNKHFAFIELYKPIIGVPLAMIVYLLTYGILETLGFLSLSAFSAILSSKFFRPPFILPLSIEVIAFTSIFIHFGLAYNFSMWYHATVGLIIGQAIRYFQLKNAA